MPLTIPAFDQYQAPLVPLRGLWNSAPLEGDHYVNAEIDWLVTTQSSAVQFSLAGNSPVALSQIVAMAVANAGCGADVNFIFPDSGSLLTVPARSSGVFPVFTNSLMFYVSAPNATPGDRTVFHVFNSMPPPVQLSQSQAQNHANIIGAGPGNGTTPLIPAGVSGTLNSVSLSVSMAAPVNGNMDVYLIDGTGHQLWVNQFTAASGQQDFLENLTNLSLRFVNGLNVVVNFSNVTTGNIVANAYYSTP